MKTLFTKEERAALDEARKYVPPDPAKFTLKMSNRSGKQIKDRQYKTFKAAENALKKAIKRDLMTSKNDLYTATIWPPGEPKYGDETEYHTDFRPTQDSVWYKTSPDKHSVMFKVYS